MFMSVMNEDSTKQGMQQVVKESSSVDAVDDCAAIYSYVLGKAERNELLNLIDLQFLSDMESITTEHLGFSMLNDELVEKINVASGVCGVYFKNLQTISQ